MTITAPVPIPAGPPVPNSSDPEVTFDEQYEDFNTWERDDLAPKANALAAASYDNALHAQDKALEATAAATSSDQSASVAMASANFKGEWSGLSGALPKPASVAKDGRFWLLLNDLADVTAAVPGVSASWLAFDILLPVIPVTTAYAELISGKEYSVLYTGGQVTLKMPPPGIGGAVVIDIANKRDDTVLLHNGGLFMDEVALDDYMLVDPGRYAARHNGVSWRGLA